MLEWALLSSSPSVPAKLRLPWRAGLQVQDVWVLERALLPSSLARWRAAAQVHLPPVRPPRVTLRRRVSEWLRRRISSGEKPLEARQEEAKARSGSGGKGDARVSPPQQVPGARAVI